MSNEIVSFGNAGLPSVKDLASSLMALKLPERGNTGEGTTYMRYDQTGHWTFGTDHTSPEEDSRWAINPLSFVHGYVAWAKKGSGPPLAEHMAPLGDPKPDVGPPPEGTGDKGWQYQLGFSLRCLDGDDEGEQTSYASNTMGCHDLVGEIVAAMQKHVAKNPETPVPVVKLIDGEFWVREETSNTIFVPKAEIVGWLSMVGAPAAASDDDDLDNLDAATPAAEEEETPRRRRRRAA